MTAQELDQKKKRDAAIRSEIARRKAQGASGSHCESEYKTNANVCVDITDGEINCNKDFSGSYYTDCEVELEYEVRTDYSGRAYLDVAVECEVEIEYKSRSSYVPQSDSDREDESHDLFAHDSESNTLEFDFSFSSFQEITSVKISDASCEVTRVDLY